MICDLTCGFLKAPSPLEHVLDFSRITTLITWHSSAVRERNGWLSTIELGRPVGRVKGGDRSQPVRCSFRSLPSDISSIGSGNEERIQRTLC